MDQSTKEHVVNLHSTDAESRYASFHYLMKLTQQPVAWAYDAWDGQLALVREGDNHQRAIAAQLLSSLARSDPQERMLRDLDRFMAVTEDERPVTARHPFQSVWKVGATSKALQKKAVDHLDRRFQECAIEKNATLIRYDIQEVFRKLYDAVLGEKFKQHALPRLETEENSKYPKKYSSIWKNLVKSATIREGPAHPAQYVPTLMTPN